MFEHPASHVALTDLATYMFEHPASRVALTDLATYMFEHPTSRVALTDLATYMFERVRTSPLTSSAGASRSSNVLEPRCLATNRTCARELLRGSPQSQRLQIGGEALLARRGLWVA
jgi:hypothetical protein